MFDYKQIEIEEGMSQFNFTNREFRRWEKYFDKCPIVTSTGYKVPAYRSATYCANRAWEEHLKANESRQ